MVRVTAENVSAAGAATFRHDTVTAFPDTHPARFTSACTDAAISTLFAPAVFANVSVGVIETLFCPFASAGALST